MNWHFSLDFDCWSSVHRSLMAESDPNRATDGLMHNFCLDDNGSCLTVSEVGFSSFCPLEDIISVGIDGGKDGRRNSEMNCVSWECVREV
jgi:hypothetical protein